MKNAGEKKSKANRERKTLHVQMKIYLLPKFMSVEPHRISEHFFFVPFFFYSPCIGRFSCGHWVDLGNPGIDVIAAAATPQPRFVILVLLKCTQGRGPLTHRQWRVLDLFNCLQIRIWNSENWVCLETFRSFSFLIATPQKGFKLVSVFFFFAFFSFSLSCSGHSGTHPMWKSFPFRFA